MNAHRCGVVVVLAMLVVACEDRLTEAQLRASLSEGMTQAQVEAFFEERDFEYSLVGREDLYMEQGLSRDASELLGRYVAIVRDVDGSLLSSESVLIYVEVGRDGTVVHVDVKRATTGV